MLNKETLDQYVEDGWLIKQVHPTLPLTIYNYSVATQYEGKWDEVTLTCRGLVVDDDGIIAARPFSKFFNLEEGKHTPTSDFEVFEKVDGSLGIFFWYKGHPVFASRGSFTSEQAVKGRELLDKYNWKTGTYAGYTYMFEILYAQNRVVVDYGGLEELVVLGVIETATGREVGYSKMATEGFVLVKQYDGIYDYQTLKGMVRDNAEGFVVCFSNGQRVKIKGEEYIRLHRIVTNLSTTSVWKVLSSGGKMEDLLVNVPDELFDKIKAYEQSLRYQYYKIWDECSATYERIRFGNWTTGPVDIEPTKKEFAEAIKDKHPKMKSVMFNMWDGKDYFEIIWKMIKPEFEKL